MAPLGPDPDMQTEDEQRKYDADRRGLLRTANRLTVAFWAWAIVVVVIGGYNSMLQRDIQNDLRTGRHEIVELQRRTDLLWERQTNVLIRLGRAEDKIEDDRDRLGREYQR